MDGFLVIDKPGGMTSRDVVNRVQKCLPRKTKLGHTGTLDPLATGVLVVGIGAATRLTELVQEMPKTYRSRFRFGVRSTTDDADGEITATPDAVLPTREQIDAAIPAFLGPISQIPPAFSAAKLSGKRAYDLAREGEAVDLAPRTVLVDAIRVLAYEPPFLDVEIDCGKGTYIRSIARDLGARLGCGGLVETLRRTRIGSFTVENAVGLNDIDARTITERLLPLSAAAVGRPRVQIVDTDSERFRNGQFISVVGGAPSQTDVAVFDESGRFLGLGQIDPAGRVRPRVVLR